ncbi:TPA: hypothetical protein ACPEUE_000050 [Proteus mirabilis]|nr:hypothetical protein [Proteus mirabilis]MDL2094290.1 hypothetical protein [Proteus mirabilis]
MTQEQKREIEQLLEPHQLKVLMLITLLSTWLEQRNAMKPET